MLFAVLLLFVFGCVSKTAEKVETVPKDKRYKQAAMAALRLQMYPKSTDNKRVLDGKMPEDFADEFLRGL